MTEAERQERLKELSEHFGFSGDEAVRKAEARELPHEPEFVEWLVLAGPRGSAVTLERARKLAEALDSEDRS